MDTFLLGFAFIMGFMSLASPCVLPIIPSYVAFLFGRGKVGIISGTLAIYCGIVVGAGGIGLALSLVGPAPSLKIFYLGAAAILILFILDATGFTFLRQLNLTLLSKKRGFFTGFIFGLLLMLVAAPCAIPLFTTTAIFALTLSKGASRVFILLAYALGLGLPLMVFGLIPELSETFKYLSGKWWTKARLLILVCTLAWLVWSFFSV